MLLFVCVCAIDEWSYKNVSTAGNLKKKKISIVPDVEGRNYFCNSPLTLPGSELIG